MYTKQVRFGSARQPGRSRITFPAAPTAPPERVAVGPKQFEQGPALSRVVYWFQPTYTGQDPLGGISGFDDTDPLLIGIFNRDGVNITPSYDCTQVEAWQLSGARWG